MSSSSASSPAAAARPSWLARLRERGVLRVAASYAAIAWLSIQVASDTFEPLGAPAWLLRALIIVAALGFPVAIALAWFLEVGEGGVTRDTAPAGVARPATSGWRRHVDIIAISLLGAIVAFYMLRDAGWIGDRASQIGRAWPSSPLQRRAATRATCASAMGSATSFATSWPGCAA